MQTNPRQLCAIGFGAFLVPAVLYLPRAGWLWATAASAILALFLAFLILLQRKSTNNLTETAAKSNFGKVLLLLTVLWNMVLLGGTAAKLCAVYEGSRTFPIVGLLLLLLAVYAAEKGVVLRVASILFFFLLGFFALILGFSLPNLQWDNLKPVTDVRLPLLTAILPPVLVLYLRRGDGETRILPWLMGGVVLAGLCALSTAGSLSPRIAAEEAFPFYEAAKSVSVLGAMERLEPLVSAAMTASGFCLLGLLCAVNARLLSCFLPRAEKLSALCNFFLGGAMIFFAGRVDARLLAAGTATFCGLIPLCLLLLGVRKNIKKM